MITSPEPGQSTPIWASTYALCTMSRAAARRGVGHAGWRSHLVRDYSGPDRANFPSSAQTLPGSRPAGVEVANSLRFAEHGHAWPQ